MHRALVLIAALGLGPTLVAAAVQAETRPEGPTLLWLCGLSAEATRLHCVADADDAGADAGAVVAVVRGTRFPLDRRQRWTVDLWSPYAGDPAWLELLARATLCYRTPACDAIVHLPATPASGRADHRP
jgi:hypothetical protein